MKQKRGEIMKKLFLCLTVIFMLTACVFASDDIVLSDEMNHMTDDPSAPVVYFTRDISPEGLMKVYKAMRKLE